MSLISTFSGQVTPQSCKKDFALVLVGKSDNFGSGRIPGEDLSRVARLWASETLLFKEVRAVTVLEAADRKPDAILLTHDWQLESLEAGFRSAWEVIRFARKYRCPVFAMLPDGFRLDLTRRTSLILSLTGGSSILLQDNEREASKFGMIFPSSTHFWNWPPSRVSTWRSPTHWQDRDNIAVIPRSGGGDYRSLVADFMESQLRGAGFEIASSNHKLDWLSYIELQQSARVSVTTCVMQPWYFKGPRWYRNRIPQFTITGRVWEAFAAGNLLITEDNSLLRGLGFLPGVHFLALPSLEEITEGKKFRIPDNSVLSQVASTGFEHFANSVQSRILSE